MFIEVQERIINLTEIACVEFNRNDHTTIFIHLKGGATYHVHHGGTLAARKTYDYILEQCKEFNKKI